MNKVLLLLGLALCTSMLYGQITIGSSVTPSKGALLDLKIDEEEGANSTKGMLLPRVQLESRTKILPTAGDKLNEHIGLTVYNVGPAVECIFSSVAAGVYVWSGLEWNPLGSGSANGDPGVAVNAHIYKDMLSGTAVTGQKLTVTEGSSLRLVGHADGNDLSYVWYKEGTTPPATKNSDGGFVLSNLQSTNRGVYHCRIYDSCDEYVTRSVTVDVIAVGSCIPITVGPKTVSIPSVGTLNPIAPNTYNVDLWNVESPNYDNVLDIALKLPDNASGASFVCDWILDGVTLTSNNVAIRLPRSDLKIGQSVVTYTAKQSGCPDQTGVIILNIGYNCSKQNVKAYIVYDKNANPANPLNPTLHLDIYNSIKRVVSATGDITYKVAVNKDKLAADKMIYIPFYKSYFKDDLEHTNVMPYEGTRELLSLPFAPEGGLKLEVPAAGTTWTTVEKIYDKKTKCSYIATFEVKIADSDCDLVAFTGLTASISDDPSDPFQYMYNPREYGDVFYVEIPKEDVEGVENPSSGAPSIYITVSIGDLSKVKSIILKQPPHASHTALGNGLYALKFTELSNSSEVVYDIEIKTTDTSCPLITRKFEVNQEGKNPK